MNRMRVATLTAACVASMLVPVPGAATGFTCDYNIYWDGIPGVGPWWALQYECGEQHPQDGCYQEIGGSEYLAFDCGSGNPSMPCDAGGCYDTR